MHSLRKSIVCKSAFHTFFTSSSILWKFHKFLILYLNSFIIISSVKKEISWNYCCRHPLNCFHPCISSVAKFNSFSIFRNLQKENNWNYFKSKRAQNVILFLKFNEFLLSLDAFCLYFYRLLPENFLEMKI